jgi:deazaflavin-dependent oxidoreductase (nitroreductase family)
MKTATSNWQLKLERPIIVFFYRLLARWIGERSQMLLLTTTGRKSGRQHTIPLIFMRVENGVVVTASNIGLDVHPGWFLNLKHNPRAHIQIGDKKMVVLAEEVPAEVRDSLWVNWIQARPGYADFQAKTVRKFSMVILKPVLPS